MAKNFHKAGSTNTFGAVAKAEQEKAQVIALQNINTENLVDNPDNGEDITMTSDLEESMKQNGFTDPMEVTDFGMGKREIHDSVRTPQTSRWRESWHYRFPLCGSSLQQ